MTAYRHVYGFGHLWADCRGPGSALESYAHFEYGSILPYLAHNVKHRLSMYLMVSLLSHVGCFQYFDIAGWALERTSACKKFTPSSSFQMHS